MKLKFRILAFLFPLNWGARYFQRGKTPIRLELAVLQKLIRAKAWITKSSKHQPKRSPLESSESERRLIRRYTAFTVLEPPIENLRPQQIPNIRLLWMAHPKDFQVLHHSIHGVLQHLRNPVSEIVIISPVAKATSKHLESRVDTDLPIRFLNDEDFMSGKNWKLLQTSLGGHAGWAASQLIKVDFILSGDSTPTLMVDSDTVLLTDKQWLFADGRQLLYFRWYENPRYEQFLRYWGFEEMDSLRSFITHHTLFQPSLLQSLMDEAFGAHDLDSLVRHVVGGADALGIREFCIDDEPYGQMLFKHYRDKVVLDKYSNVNMSLPRSDQEFERLLRKLRHGGRFNSVSFHNPSR